MKQPQSLIIQGFVAVFLYGRDSRTTTRCAPMHKFCRPIAHRFARVLGASLIEPTVLVLQVTKNRPQGLFFVAKGGQ